MLVGKSGFSSFGAFLGSPKLKLLDPNGQAVHLEWNRATGVVMETVDDLDLVTLETELLRF